MVGHRAGGLGATHSWAGVPALVLHTGEVPSTLLVDGALRLALSVRISLQPRQTGTGGRLVPLSADSIEAAGTWSAGINDLRSWCCGDRSVAAGEGVSDISLVADTDRNMVSNSAVSIDPTQSWAGILTFSVDTCFV